MDKYRRKSIFLPVSEQITVAKAFLSLARSAFSRYAVSFLGDYPRDKGRGSLSRHADLDEKQEASGVRRALESRRGSGAA